MKNTFNKVLCIITLIAGIAFGVAGLCLPPIGVIDNSVLILVAQLLVYSASVIKIKINNVFKSNSNKKP